VRSGGDVDDRVRPVHELELLVVPGRALGALVLAVPHLPRLALQSRRGCPCVEDELDQLPVALVLVVEVVERVEEPVLERELPRMAGVVRGMGVRRRLRRACEPVAPPLVVAPRIERSAGEVEVVLVEALRKIGGRRRDPDQIGRAPGPA
jgi:hypothetical protein